MYVKVFSSIFDGSLYGKFEATIVFLALLVLADKDGDVDMTPEKIAAASGYPLDIVQRGLDELEAPDPRSRTPDMEGRRIVKIHEAGWGWRIVNYCKYRDIRSTEERREYFREKKREQRAAAKSKLSTNVQIVHRSPPESTVRHPSDSYSEAEAEKTKSSRKRSPTLPVQDFKPESIPGLNLEAWGMWVEYRKGKRKPIRPQSMKVAAEEMAKLCSTQMQEVRRAIAGGWQGLHPEPVERSQTQFQTQDTPRFRRFGE